MNPLLVNIKQNSLDDGPGIRTVLFFKGCPLSCVWCQNPETKSAKQELSFEKDPCTNCKQCIQVCEVGAIDKKYRINRELCNLCGKCVDVCPTNALKFVGKQYSVKELMELILKDKVFFDNSGGGVTLTGGEPTYHMDYVHKLLLELKAHHLHVCLETCGFFKYEPFEQLILPYVDLLYFDLKILDPIDSQTYCGVPNKQILRNFEALLQHSEVDLLPRVPLVPEITATETNLNAIAAYLRSLGVQSIGLLPYNPLWISKAEALGIELEYSREKWMSEKEKGQVKQIFADFEFRDF